MPLDPDLLGAYLAACLVLILLPGPDMMFVLGQTLAGGARRGWAAVLGILLGALCHVALAALGVAAVIAAEPALFSALRLAGAAYLIWLGLQALRQAWSGGAVAVEAAPGAPRAPGVLPRGVVVQGALTNLLNPKVGLFFLAFLPQFVDPGRAPAAVQMLLLGPLLPILAVPFFALVIAGAGRAAGWLSRSARASRALNGAAGAIFLGLGVRLLLAPR
ncbi:LysE family translocator [Roseomonas sp. BN140053]|uniref:LysE family translocator n=1 Tax=Roseomonas sp. BN140053 TaxID=3391898 RepID=UPI0039EC7DAB